MAVVRNKSAIGRRIKPGDRFGRLLTIGFTRVRNSNPAWTCQCDCGNQATVVEGQLLVGKTKSCGCLQRQACSRTGKLAKVHGLSNTPTYSSWVSMKSRCRNTGRASQRHYGLKGIKVCEQWHSFARFLSDMGIRPSLAHTLDRIRSEGNYEPGNCRWATHFEQARNRSTNHKISAFGEDKCMSEWIADPRCAVSRKTICQRIAQGMTTECALTKPRSDQGRPR